MDTYRETVFCRNCGTKFRTGPQTVWVHDDPLCSRHCYAEYMTKRMKGNTIVAPQPEEGIYIKD